MSTTPEPDEVVEGCPDCRQDTLTVTDDGLTRCTNVACGWRE